MQVDTQFEIKKQRSAQEMNHNMAQIKMLERREIWTKREDKIELKTTTTITTTFV